jgi:hypothetical protein
VAIEHTFNLSINRGGQLVESLSFASSPEGEINRDMTVAASQTNVALGIAIPTLSKIKSLFISGDQDFTLETNDSGTPQETLAFTADVPLVWDARMPGFAIGDLFAGAITNVYVTTGAITSSLNLKIYITLDVP